MQHSFVNNTPNVSTSGQSFAPGSNPMGTIEEEENAESVETVDGESTDEEFLVDEEPLVILPQTIDPLLWCARAENWTGIINETLVSGPANDVNANTDAEDSADTTSRNLALKTTEEALVDEDIEEQLIEAEANPLRVIVDNGVVPDWTIESASIDQDLGTAELTFKRPFNATVDGISFDQENPYYRVYLNWGVFDNETDNSTEKVFGAKSEVDASNFTFYAATQAQKVFASVAVLSTLVSLAVI